MAEVRIPWFGFSETIVDAVPRPAGVVVGGVWWGAAAPALLAMLAYALLSKRRGVARILAAWMGFCWIANGAYLAAGAYLRVGDPAELLAFGYSRSGMILIGTALVVAGLYVWHVLTQRRVAQVANNPTRRRN